VGTQNLSQAVVEEAMHRLWVCDPKGRLRRDDLRKAAEITGFLAEIHLVLGRFGKRPIRFFDAAAGKAYVGLLAAEMLFNDERRDVSVITLEREPLRVAASRDAAGRVRSRARIECLEGDVADASHWRSGTSIVAGLHACGGASDAIIERAIESRVECLLLVPCCTGQSVAAMARAEALAEHLAIPRQAPVRRRFLQAIVDAERTFRLEAAGYRTEVVEFVAPTVTPHNLLFRAILTHDEGRAERAQEGLSKLFG
jgi:Methyltransferase domain